MNSYDSANVINGDLSPISSLREAVTPGSQSSSQMSGYLANVNWQTIIIIVLLLALLGFNIFAYLARGTEIGANLFDTIVVPVLKWFGYTSLTTTKQVIQTSGTGAKTGIDIVTDTTSQTIDTITNNQQQPKPTQAPTQQYNEPVQQQIQQAGSAMEWQQDSLEVALSNASSSQPGGQIEAANTSGESGWCYIGTDRGVRTCGEVGVNDMCMSGDVFPSQEICMNPSLRA